jgi:integrase
MNSLTHRTIRQIETLLRGALADTVGPNDDDYLEYNPLQKLSLMKVEASDQREIVLFQIDEQKKLILEARKYADKQKDPRWFIRPLLALKLGIRAGEIAGLK